MKPRRSWDIEGKGNKLYGRRWRKARAAFLSINPVCCMCKRTGRDEAATVVDHIIPHRGDEALFWDARNWQALCEAHHNGEKATIEARGFSDRIGDDGWPVDPVHPANIRVGGVVFGGEKERAPASKVSIYLVSEENDGKTANSDGIGEIF